MTRVDFYLVDGDQQQVAEKFACRLIEKAYKQGLRVFVLTCHEEQSRRLDELLWTFTQGSFVPHTRDRCDDISPIFIHHGSNIDTQFDLLVNMKNEIVDAELNVERIAEVVSADPQQRAQARERYRQYRERDVELHSHNM